MSLDDLIRDVHGDQKLKVRLEQYLRFAGNKPSNRADGWHPSQFCDMCAREHVIRALLKEPDVFEVSTRLRRIFDYGTALHDWYQNNYLGPMGILWGRWKCSRCKKVQWGFMPEDRCSCAPAESTQACAMNCKRGGLWDPKLQDERGGCIHCGIWGRWEYAEVPVKYEHEELSKPVVGHSDGLVKLDCWRVLEMKSINERGFKMLPDAKPSHRNQAELYGELIRMGKTTAPKSVRVPKPKGAVVMYLAKNTSEEKEFSFDLDQARAQKLLSQPVLAERSLREGKKLPIKHQDCDTMFAKRAEKCDMRTWCFGQKSFQQLAQIRRK